MERNSKRVKGSGISGKKIEGKEGLKLRKGLKLGKEV